MTSDPFGIAGTIVDGRYRVERVAGQGGFGVVYRAYHLAFESAIALKILKLPTHWSLEQSQARTASFQREGRMLFELSLLDPSIVRAFETGTIRSPDGTPAPYLALEWLDGASLDQELKLRRKLRRSPLTLSEVLEILAAPAWGLAHAHAKGIAHRDIKPANLFVCLRNGEPNVKILDFGIAKVVGDIGDTTAQLAATSGTTASFTPMYAAPEQWLNRLGATGPWTDVHAFALVCVELLTGEAALAGREPAQFMASSLDSVRPTPASRGLELPPAIEAVFARALALEPRERFRDLGAFWRALREAAAWTPDRRAARVEILSLDAAIAESAENAARASAVASLPGLAGGYSTTAATASLASVAREHAVSRRWASRFPWLIAAGLTLLGLAVYYARQQPRVDPRSGEPLTGTTTTTTTVAASVVPASATVPAESARAMTPGAAAVPAEPSTHPIPPPTRARAVGSAPRASSRAALGVVAEGGRWAMPASSATSLAPGASQAASSPEVDIDDPALTQRK